MSFATVRQAVYGGFHTGFAVARPSFPTASILYDRSSKEQPATGSFLRVVFSDLDPGRFTYIGSPNVRQTALLTVEVFVPRVVDMNEVEDICEDILEVLKVLIIPANAIKSRLGKRDFANSLGGYAHSRVSMTINYDA